MDSEYSESLANWKRRWHCSLRAGTGYIEFVERMIEKSGWKNVGEKEDWKSKGYHQYLEEINWTQDEMSKENLGRQKQFWYKKKVETIKNTKRLLDEVDTVFQQDIG